LGEPFDLGCPPYQDAFLLYEIRNELLHYNMPIEPTAQPTFIVGLQKRKIFLSDEGAWISKASSLEGIKWAHNTACATIRDLGDQFGEKNPIMKALSIHPFFNPI
jgi:hypothetical protein